MSDYAKQRIGRVLKGKYTLEKLLGVGGMAAVYLARHRNGNPVAIKMLHPEISLSPEIRERFVREGYVANRVGHRGAVRVLDDDVAEDGSIFLVMELLEGESIEHRANQAGGRLPLHECVEVGIQLLDVLAAAHDKGVLHRDIKPDNVFWLREGGIKVLDFGIARLREAGSSPMTQTGHLLGTPAYMSPEQALGRSQEMDARADVYAVGATLFRLVSGQYVHEGSTTQEMLVYAASKPARSLAAVAPAAPPWLVALVDRALAFEKEERWPSAAAMRDALKAGSAGAQGASAEAWATLPIPMERVVTGKSMPQPAPHDGTAAGLSRTGATKPAPAASGAIARWTAAAVAIVGIASAGLFVLGRNARPAEAPAPAVGIAAVPGEAPSPPLASPSPPPSAQNAVTPAAAPVLSLAPTPAGLPVSIPKSAAPSASRRPGAASAASAAAPAPAASSSPTPTPARTPGRTDPCDPPFTLDSAGRRIPKPSCL